MGKKKRQGQKNEKDTATILLVTAIINMVIAVLNLIADL